MKFLPVGLVLIAGLCAALAREQSAHAPESVKTHILTKPDGYQARKASLEPAYLDDYIVNIKDGAQISQVRDLLSHLKQKTADRNAPSFHAHVEEEDIHEEMGIFAIKKVLIIPLSFVLNI